VRILQNRLIVLGYLSGTANGKFETTTEAAVMAFQKRHNMYADGIAGPDTLTKLYSSSAKKADRVVANLGSLKEKSQGDGVRALQRNLRTLGYYTGNIDGDYGPSTLAAVTAFQAANGLTADGIAGNSTQGAILVAINGGSTGGAGSGSGAGSGNNGSTSPVTYGSTATSNGYTTISSTNGNSANISAVQSALRAKGYYSGSLDGKYGSGTQKAVEEFQRSQGLRVTGMAGPSTQRMLYGGTAASGSYKKLELGSSGSDVKALQYALYEMKYYDGNITGKYDEATESAVMLFQDCNELEIDGIAGQKTQQLLFSSSAKPCTK
jgi:peptidoglycan hydrolase-like protein with peptidoglycan-binding domain